MYKFGQVKAMYQEMLVLDSCELDDLRNLLVKMDTIEIQAIKKND